jgi:hypothetical protein
MASPDGSSIYMQVLSEYSAVVMGGGTSGAESMAFLGMLFPGRKVQFAPFNTGRPSRYGFDQLQFLIAWSFEWKFSDDYIKASQKYIAEFNDALS